MPLVPGPSASLSFKFGPFESGPSLKHEEIVKPVVVKPIAMKIGAAARCLCALTALMLGQPLFGQQPPAQPEAPAPQQQNPAATTAPAEISKDDPDYGEPLGLFYWLSKGRGTTLPGNAAQYYTQEQVLGLPNARPRSPGAFVSIPAGKFNHLELSYFQVDGDGTGYATSTLSLLGSTIPQGDFISTTTTVRDAQITWNYLTWPAPPEDSKWRVRTLWSFDYTSVTAVVDAPFEPNVDFVAAHGTRNIFYPTFGISTEYIPNKYFYFEARTWGFGFPHKADIADAEVNAVFRFKHLEVFGGYKYFHYKTSPGSTQFFESTLTGPLGGLRWVFR
jgi:hypothetical protein